MSNCGPGSFRPSSSSGSAVPGRVPASSAATKAKTGGTKRTANDAGLLTDANGAYRPPSFGDFGLYMNQKRHKLYVQDATERSHGSDDPSTTQSASHPQIFAGMSIHINGYVQEVTQQELKDMILQHGGRYDHYLSKSGTTHIVASNLTEAKKVEFRRYKVASPKWILDSICQGKLLPWHQYSVLAAAGTTLFDMGAAPVPVASSPMRVPPPPPPPPVLPPPPAAQDATMHTSPTKPDARRSVLNAATDPDSFLTSYYQNSRLSFLSRWKAELQALIRPFQESRSLNPPAPAPHRIILHIDMDSFFASVTLRDRPDLRHLPVAVSHSTVARDDSTAEIASCNYIARNYGVRNGIFVAQAKQLCPALVLVPYAFDQYKATTAQVYRVLMDVADNLQAVSCDEAYLDVSSRVGAPATPQKVLALANDIRARIERVTGGCTASVGAADSMLLARLATRKAKPNGAVWWTRNEYLRERGTIRVADMPGVGWKMGKRLKEMGVETCLDVVTKIGKDRLMRELGKKYGQTLFDACEGVDARTFGHRARQTVSAEVNYGIRFQSVEEAHTFLTKLSHEVSHRLTQVGSQTSQITLKLMIRSPHAPVETRKFLGHGVCDSHSRSTSLPTPTNSPQVIAHHVIALLDAMAFPPADLRGIGISCTRLVGGLAEEPWAGDKRPHRDGADLRQMFGRVAARGGALRERMHAEEAPGDEDIDWDVDEGDSAEEAMGGATDGAGSSLHQQLGSDASGIDWAVFNDLPPDIQAELRQQWNGSGKPPANHRDRVVVKSAGWKGKGKPKTGGSRAAPPTLTSTTGQASTSRPARDGKITDEQVEQALFQDVDASVLLALPSDIRAELLAEKRRDLESEAAARLIALQLTPPQAAGAIILDSDESDSDNTASTRAAAAAKINNVLTPPTGTASTTSTCPPNLLGRSDLMAIRSLLRDWITHTAHHAAETDVDTDAEFVAQYAEALVDTGWMDWGKMVVQWLKYLAGSVAVKGGEEEGAEVVKALVARVEERVRAKVREVTGGGELVVDDW